MEEPGSFAGMRISPSPHRGPEASQPQAVFRLLLIHFQQISAPCGSPYHAGNTGMSTPFMQRVGTDAPQLAFHFRGHGKGLDELGAAGARFLAYGQQRGQHSHRRVPQIGA